MTITVIFIIVCSDSETDYALPEKHDSWAMKYMMIPADILSKKL